MVHFLRNKNNKTIIETEVWGVDDDLFEIISTVLVNTYSMELIYIYESAGVYKKDVYDFIQDINYLSNLRGYYYEKLKYKIKTLEELNDFVKSEYKVIAEKYNLKYISD